MNSVNQANDVLDIVSGSSSDSPLQRAVVYGTEQHIPGSSRSHSRVSPSL